MKTNEKALVCDALHRWIKQRPGLEFGNYGELKSYNAELRSIAKDKRDAETLLRAVQMRESISAQAIIQASASAFSGRLTIKLDKGKCELSYCTGQYWPTEYRAAAAAVCASVLWDSVRSSMPAPNGPRITRTVGTFSSEHDNIEGLTPGDWLRRYFKNMFGRSIQKRWFN